uniref:von Willebrand factor type A domain protein n=1 Tax=Pseudomonas phage Cygsa01 TaxID=3138529 RepID=A0AAU6W3J2_9VIRU
MTALILDLEKAKDMLILDLEKAGVLEIPTMEVRLAMDFSTSMQEEYANGYVSNTVDLFLGAALAFDDNETLDVGFFNSDFTVTEQATAKDVGRYLQRVGRTRPSGGTNYAPIIHGFETRQGTQKVPEAVQKPVGILGRLFGGTKKLLDVVNEGGVSPYKAYVGVITDGDNMDPTQFEQALRGTSGDTFFQFFAIGNQVRLEYLTRIAAQYPHVAFAHIPEPHKQTTGSFYELIANPKLAAWING